MLTCGVSLQVLALDQLSDGLNATAQVHITVLDYNDNSPRFPLIPEPLDFPEGPYTEEEPGHVFSIQATDADLGPNGDVVLSLASPHPAFRLRQVKSSRTVEPCRPEAPRFVLLQDGTLLAVGDLDRESRETYELVVKACDNGSPQREVSKLQLVRNQ